MSGVLCHLDSFNDTTSHDDGWWFWSALSSGLIDGYIGLNVGHIYPEESFQHSVMWNESCS